VLEARAFVLLARPARALCSSVDGAAFDARVAMLAASWSRAAAAWVVCETADALSTPDEY